MARMPTSAVRRNLSDLVNRVAYRGERIILYRHSKDMAALVSVEDLAKLEALEDELDVRAARRALAEAKRKGERPILWKKVKRSLGR